METENRTEIKQVTPAQEVLLSKLLKSKLLLDAEYREFREVLDKRVICSFDASVLIAHVLGILRYRRQFNSKRSKAYKKCHFCKSRDKITRIENLALKQKFWSCETCFLNLDSSQFVSVNGFEENEVKADAIKKDPEALGYKLEE